MEYRLLGGSGLKVSALSFGAATFGGGNEFFKAWGDTDVAEATRLIEICFEAGVNLFDTADGYSDGRSEVVLAKALGSKRERALISTKAYFPTGDGPNDRGTSRYHLCRALEDSLRRLNTDYIDIYHLHGFDALTPIEEVQDPTGAGDSFAGGFMGYLASQEEINREVLKRALFYGGVMGSFAVERFGTERLQGLTREAIDARFEIFRELTRLD